MTLWSRRAALGGAIAAVSTLAASGLSASPARVPVGPMHLKRTLVRDLSDGNRIRVFRIWQIAFTPQGAGWAVEGKQVGVEVDAPGRLAPIAEIERQRSTDGKFPILIDAAGLIVAAGEAEHQADVDRAIDLAVSMAAQQGATLTERERLQSALRQVQAAGNSLLDRVPRDLFFPKDSGFSEKRAINLPNGGSGLFQVNYSVSARPLSGLLDHADRRVITRVNDSVQTSSEHWELQAI